MKLVTVPQEEEKSVRRILIRTNEQSAAIREEAARFRAWLSSGILCEHHNWSSYFNCFSQKNNRENLREEENYHGSNITECHQQPENCHKTLHHFKLCKAMSLYSLHGKVFLRSTTWIKFCPLSCHNYSTSACNRREQPESIKANTYYLGIWQRWETTSRGSHQVTTINVLNQISNFKHSPLLSHMVRSLAIIQASCKIIFGKRRKSRKKWQLCIIINPRPLLITCCKKWYGSWDKCDISRPTASLTSMCKPILTNPNVSTC